MSLTIAVALFILGAESGSTAKRARIKLHIGYNMVLVYVSRTGSLVAAMACRYIIYNGPQKRFAISNGLLGLMRLLAVALAIYIALKLL